MPVILPSSLNPFNSYFHKYFLSIVPHKQKTDLWPKWCANMSLTLHEDSILVSSIILYVTSYCIIYIPYVLKYCIFRKPPLTPLIKLRSIVLDERVTWNKQIDNTVTNMVKSIAVSMFSTVWSKFCYIWRLSSHKNQNKQVIVKKSVMASSPLIFFRDLK